MKNRKGFTLTELLAVLVLLAIIALIVVPIVLSDIYKSRENAHKRSIENYGREVEKAYVEAKMKKGSIPKTLSEMKDLITYSGDTVTCDQDVNILNNDKIELYNCYVGDENKQKSKYKYNYINGKLEQVVSDNDSQEDNVDDKSYEIGNEIELSEAKYNIIGVTEGYVTLLKQEPLTVSEIESLGMRADYNWENDGASRDWAGILYDDNSSNYYDSNIRNYVDTWANNEFQNDELVEVDGYSARLITLDDLMNFYPNCSNDKSRCDVEENTQNWLYKNEYYYYTMTQYHEWPSEIWVILGNGDLGMNGVSVGPSGAIRPVINIKKSAIK